MIGINAADIERARKLVTKCALDETDRALLLEALGLIEAQERADKPGRPKGGVR